MAAPDSDTDEHGDPAARLQALRDRGAQRCDPARFSHLELLAARAARARGLLRPRLQSRLAAAVADYEARAARALQAAALAASACGGAHGDAAPALQRLHDDGDVPALRRLAARLQGRGPVSGPLAALLRAIDGHPADAAPAGRLRSTPPAELKALDRARGTWARLRVQRQISRSLATVPQNPGPLNSQLLAVRALQHLQSLSPAYLERFIAHAETLQWLEQVQAQGTARGPAAPGRSGARAAGRAGPAA